jgi:hypothetical protein
MSFDLLVKNGTRRGFAQDDLAWDWRDLLDDVVAASASIGSARATAILFGQKRFPDTTAGARHSWFSLTPPLDAA